METREIEEEQFLIREIDTHKYYWCKCENCGWEDSSEFTEGCHPIADTGDYTDPICPVCDCNKLEGEPVLDVPSYEGIVKVKVPMDLILDPYKKTVARLKEALFEAHHPIPSTPLID